MEFKFIILKINYLRFKGNLTCKIEIEVYIYLFNNYQIYLIFLKKIVFKKSINNILPIDFWVFMDFFFIWDH